MNGILSMYRVIRSIPCLSGYKFQGFPRIITSISSYFNSCLKVTNIYYLTDIHIWISFSLSRFQYNRHRSVHGWIPTIVRDSRDQSQGFMFSSYDIDFFDRICFVYIVMALIVLCLFGCILTVFLTVTLYIPSCVVHLPKWHMMWAHLENFTVLLCSIVLEWLFIPRLRLFVFWYK